MRRPSLAAFVLSGLAACDKSPAGSPSVSSAGFCSAPSALGGGTSPAAACQGYIDDLRGHAARCGNSVIGLDSPDFVAFCVTLVSLPGSSSFTASKLAACGARNREIPCSENVNDTCECSGTTMHGTLPDGAACVSGLQCASDVCSVESIFGSDFSCGTCLPRTPIGGTCGKDSTLARCALGSKCSYSDNTCIAEIIAHEGESCDSKNATCDTGLSCELQEVDGGAFRRVCRRGGDEGAPCGTCAAALRCIKGTCQQPGRAGAACMYDSHCVASLVCDKQICAAPVLLGLGQPCATTVTATANPLCGAGLYCPPTGAQPKVCTAYKARGDACSPGVALCTPFTSCLDGRCVTPDFSVCH